LIAWARFQICGIISALPVQAAQQSPPVKAGLNDWVQRWQKLNF